MRHGVVTEYDPKPGMSVSTLAWDYAPGFQVPEHGHGADQLIFATHGVMEVASGESLWLIPPHFGIWIPARTLHSIRMPGAVSMRTLYFRPGLTQGMPAGCAVLHVTPLLRELIVHTVSIGQLSARRPLHRALRDVIVAQLAAASPVPVTIRLPRDPRAMAVAQALLRGLADRPALHDLCRAAGIGVRTAERIFRGEVGTDFEAWRKQVRLMRGIELLARGSSVKEAAFATGYRQPSAFVAMFRLTMGATPKAWLKSIAAHW